MTTIHIIFKVGKNGEEFTEKQESFFNIIKSKIIKAINSDQFRKDVESYSFKPKIGRRKYYYRMNRGYSRKKIFDLLISGKDNFGKTDFELDIILKPYTDDIKYHAMTYDNSQSIYINTKYIDKCLSNKEKYIPRMSNTLIHEYLHNMGFRHKTNKPSDYNDTTVPWAIGKIVENLTNK